MESGLAKILDVAAGGTQYAPSTSGVEMQRFYDAGITIDHPGGGTSTTYTLEVSNMTLEEIRQGKDDWSTYSSVTIPVKASAEKFNVEVDEFLFARLRVKAVTSAGTGVATIRICTKAP